MKPDLFLWLAINMINSIDILKKIQVMETYTSVTE